MNKPLAEGDPTVAKVRLRAGQSVRGPFAGRSTNCRSCHFVEELSGAVGGGPRDYSDFAPRSPVPDRGDGFSTTARNAMSMVDSSIPRPGATFLHYDGEFVSNQALVRATITGRNFGWLPNETTQAIAHIARVVREDNCTGLLGALFGGSYRRVFASPADMPALLRLPKEYTLDVTSASDEEIFQAVVSALSDYLDSLVFSRDSLGAHNGSPYDLFLAKNGLPRAPSPGESDAQYIARLSQMVAQLRDPKWVVPADGMFRLHFQFYQFGPLELQGLRIFLQSPTPQPSSGLAGKTLTDQNATSGASVAGGVGNCAACHLAPHFTDFGFHNTGVSQEEYDAVHGTGAFAQLDIPTLAQREAERNRYLPATPQHPAATGAFRSPARADSLLVTDLGMWNVFANADYPEPQQAMMALLCGTQRGCTREAALAQSVARFKTPALRDLGTPIPICTTAAKQHLKKSCASTSRFHSLRVKTRSAMQMSNCGEST